MKFFILYLLLINAAGFAVMLADKSFAKKKMRRIPEATLMTVAAIGGSVGVLFGMYAVRHKTRHKKFTLGVPAVLLAQIALLILISAFFA